MQSSSTSLRTQLDLVRALALGATLAAALATSPATAKAQLAWAPLDPFGGVCSTIEFPPPANLDICEYLIRSFSVDAVERLVPTCGEEGLLDPRFYIPECHLPSPGCFINPLCIVPKLVIDVAGYIYYADEVECSPDLRTVTDLVEDAALQQIENFETMTLGGVNSAFYTVVGQHIDFLECSAQPLSSPLKDIMRRMRDRVGFSKDEAFADLDLDTIRITSGDASGASTYLRSNRAITLGHLVIIEQRPSSGRPMWDILSHWTRTWDDVINGRLCPQERAALSLILHEAVHVRQYRNLGKEHFINQYLPDLLISNAKEAEAFTFSESKVNVNSFDSALLDPSVPDHGAVVLELDDIVAMLGEPLGCAPLPPSVPGPGGPLAVTPAADGRPTVQINSICGAMTCAPGLIECDQPHAATIHFDGAASDPMGIRSSEWFIPLGPAGARTTLGTGFAIDSVLPSQSPGVSGRHRIDFSAIDGEGNVAVATTVINVRDTMEPMLTLNPGPATIECNVGTYVEPSATASDICDPAATTVTISGSVNRSVTGPYTITYSIVDDEGNLAVQARTVTVVDTTNPTIDAPPEIVTQDRTPNLGTPITSDLCTAPIAHNDAPAIFPYGTTIVTWWSTDAAGNESAHDTQVVTVLGGDASSAGRDFSCDLSRDGEVFCWGADDAGQLGDGATIDRWGPRAIDMTSVARQVSVGARHACAVKADGSVQCWGSGQDGRLGNGSTLDRSAPVNVSSLTGAVQVSAGGQVQLFVDDGHSCAVLDTGGVKCWGENGQGQLGDATSTDRTTPVTTQLPSGTSAMQVTAGGAHSCAVDSIGRAFCWGAGANGRLGNNATSDRNVPQLVSFPSGVQAVQIDAGERHTCGVDGLGSVWCWGSGANGRLGNNTLLDRSVPVRVTLPASAVQVSAGVAHTCALLTDGRVFCWGSPLSGRLGDGTVIFDQLVPIQSVGISNAVQVSAGSDHSCARLFDGSALRDVCWGDNNHGELGDGTSVARATQVQISTLCEQAGFFPPSAGAAASCLIGRGAAASPQTAMCWGANGYGQLGEGTGASRRAPTPVVGTSNAQLAAAGGLHGCALTGTGGVQCWGNNLFGQLGDGTLLSRQTPVSISGGGSWAFVATGANHSCGITSGQVKCWGANTNGQLGDGTILPRLVPTPVTGVPGQAMYLDLGDRHSCAVVQNGTSREVWCWGANLHGQLGNGLFLDSWVPVRAGTIADAWVVSAGANHTCATTTSGPVFCWGQSLLGQVGNDVVFFDAWSPQQVLDAGGAALSAPFAFVSAGGSHSCVAPVGPMQQAACWGNNLLGQLGNGNILPNPRAQTVPGLAFVSFVTAGDNHSCARVSSTGTMCWGDNSSGQLGDGTVVNRSAPVRAAGACF